ncbi:MAG: SH3 domain-containing protein [Pyrinomonadaceae bacterium]|nr:SH3 domain-containing protein [Pyrinomonadaceae bacterium]
MKRSMVLSTIILLFVAAVSAQGVKSVRRSKKSGDVQKGSAAVVIDRRLSVLREGPGLYQPPVKRLETGTKLTVFEEKEGDGVLFYKVSDRTAVTGWIQAEAIAGSFRKNDDQRVAQLILGSSGFQKVHRSVIFLELFPDSPFRPTILLLLGDEVEDQAAAISENARKNLKRREMAAAQAPLHSFFLNYEELDRYRNLGIRFLFNGNTQILHYNGDSWLELTRNFPESSLTIEARERISSLTKKMQAKE